MPEKILIVDDEPDIIEPLALLLESEGHIVESTTKASEVFAKIAEFKPSLLFLDVLLSGEDGRKICKKIKADNRTIHLAVILMSAHPTANEDSFESGADGFIAKPFDIIEVFKLVEFLSRPASEDFSQRQAYNHLLIFHYLLQYQ